MRLLLDVMMPGDPVGKGRPRFRRRGKYVQTYTPAKTDAWEDDLALLARAAWANRAPSEGPIELHVLAMKKRPKRMCTSKWPDGLLLRSVKPDGDNTLKIVADALQKAAVIADDAHISRWSCDCVYGAKGAQPATIVRLYAMDEARLDDVRSRWDFAIKHHQEKKRCSSKEPIRDAQLRRSSASKASTAKTDPATIQ